MRNRLAWIAGALGAAGVAYRALRQRTPATTTADPRADQLRQKLDESKGIGDDRAEFESGEPAVDEVEEPSVDEKRAAAHERGRVAAKQMRAPKAEG